MIYWALFAGTCAVFSLGFACGAGYASDQRDRREKEREELREAAWRHRQKLS